MHTKYNVVIQEQNHKGCEEGNQFKICEEFFIAWNNHIILLTMILYDSFDQKEGHVRHEEIKLFASNSGNSARDLL